MQEESSIPLIRELLAESNDNITTGWQVFIIPVLFSLLIISGGVLFYRFQRNKIRSDKERELNAVISLKVSDIAAWRKEHIRDARVLGENPGLSSIMNNFLNGAEGASTLRNILLPIIEDYDYESILLADTNNIIKFSSSGNVNIEPLIRYSYPKSNTPDLQLSTDSSMIFLDIPYEFTDENGHKAGTLILRVNPDITLFPNIQRWPTPSKTAETLLLRREGDSVLYLNELRHRTGTALELMLPASDTNLPAARALTGYEGYFEGTDYRGVEVVSILRRIPDSSWYMVAKIDKSEVYAPLVEQVFLITMIVLLTITTFVIILRLYFRNQRIKYLNELNRTKDNLYSIISHDLKNPFVSIMGFSELLYERSLLNDFSKTTEFSSIIYSSSRNAIELLHNLTGWTKLQTGRALFNPIELDLGKLIYEVIEFCNPSALMKSISIKVTVSSYLKVKADKEMISTILRNLVHNAVKFSFKESEISITAGRSGNMAVIEISDSGIGLDKQNIEWLLTQNSIKSTPGTSNEKGTGLGIYICKEFIAMHKGSLEIISEPGKGSRFVVSIPV